MLESILGKNFEYKRLTEDEMKSRNILGRLVGVIADYKNPTRNERLYGEELWEKVFKDPIMQEKIENRLVVGELGHPEDRLETNPEKIAICLAEVPKKSSDGKLMGVFDIIDTPNGRILNTLCQYGCKMGVSSRGDGQIIEDYNGSYVDSDSYVCEGWDAVIIPAVKAARPTYVTESLHRKPLTEALNKVIEESPIEEQPIMKETLKELNIDVTPKAEENKLDSDTTKLESEALGKDIDDVVLENEEKTDEADNDGATVIDELKEALKANRQFEKQVKELQEQLSVSYAKEMDLQAELLRYKESTIRLGQVARSAKATEQRLNALQEQLSKTMAQKDEQTKTLNENLSKIKTLKDSETTISNKVERLNESIKERDTTIRQLKAENRNLQSQIDELENNNKDEIKSLRESLEQTKTNSTIKANEYRKKLTAYKELVEKYQSIAKTAVDKYISQKAIALGIDKKEILSRLTENYSFGDIDNVCEDLRKYKVSVGNLPFQINKSVRATITESKEPIMKSVANQDEDELDPLFLSMTSTAN